MKIPIKTTMASAAAEINMAESAIQG